MSMCTLEGRRAKAAQKCAQAQFCLACIQKRPPDLLKDFLRDSGVPAVSAGDSVLPAARAWPAWFGEVIPVCYQHVQGV